MDFSSMESDFHTMEGMEPPPGTIIFSPQDLMRPSKPMGRGRGRGARSSLACIKQEPVGPPTFGGSQTLEMPVSCEVCGKVMMTGKTLVQHMAIHSDLKPFQCPHCPKSFARKVHLQGHLVVHGIEKQFECPVCHQRFSRQDCVKVHMRLHDKSKCVYCDVCHKAFLTVGALNIHLRIHRGEKPFKCHLCSKCFTQKNHLITHIKRHTKVADEHFTKKLGPRMFKCEYCPRSFIRLSDYERHVQWNHGAVAEGSILDKLPTVGNLLDGELKQTGLAPQIFKAPKDALNSKPKTRRAKKVMCTTSTQTDEEGGRVIIPRQYQGQVSASTQVSAPPTPRPADDDMYENDIFDEGMDRNYSSDEEEGEEQQERGIGEDQVDRKVFAMPDSTEMASDPIQDAAFDAIVQGNSKSSREAGSEVTRDGHSEFLQEVVSSMTRQCIGTKSEERSAVQEIGFSPEDQQGSVTQGQQGSVTQDQQGSMAQGQQGSAIQDISALEVRAVHKEDFVLGPQVNSVRQDSRVEDQEVVNKSQILDIQSGRGRGEQPPSQFKRPRGRGRKHSHFGLSGAAELRAIRKSMMKNILSYEPEETKNSNASGAEESRTTVEAADLKTTTSVPEEGETEGRGKRMSKNKQHGKDFVCNMKNCETCFTTPKSGVKTQTKVKVKVKEKDSSEKSSEAAAALVRKFIHNPPKEPVKQILKDITRQPDKRPLNVTNTMQNVVSSMAKSSDNSMKRVKVENRPDDTKMKVGNRVGSYPVDITANPLSNKSKKEDYFVTTSNSGNIVSPPVELMSFCIPTYSCKLCSREFRFEGKLHRHIESVHQNKAIFSPDVKPGRGSSKMVPSTSQQPILPHPPPQLEPENPEIAALRSEWDDDDDDIMEPAAVAVSTGVSVNSFTGPHPTMTIVTREIAPVTTTITDVYSSGVKVNMNKLAGLLPQPGKTIPINYEGSRVKNEINASVSSAVEQSHPTREPETIMADTLDMKCRRLLEKLFDHDLLLSCGLLEEHVSVVLGRVLQHYGVKMIEDYGQGQYEVLKYNLWRLIEWKVTMEQMEEFYTAGKSVEEMMDDIMNEQVPLVSHHFVPQEQAAQGHVQVNQAGQVAQVEAVDVGDGQMVLQHVAGVLGGQINLPEGVTQVVLSQDVPPDLLQGAHIVTIDPTTGQVISQVTADQVILADSIGEELEQVSALDGQVVVSQAHVVNQSVSQGNIVVTHSSATPVEVSQAQISHGQVIVQAAPSQQGVKLETSNNSLGHSAHQQ
ncbi:Gastrula zinc finger protein XlCGF8.2DB-like [Homarus americanus]|uniref:Gastrula zinc finger protein XlCGF8.2DB-like n=1 Tax=Homarus americanus TaxID=6706 RepID=A0A8J5MJL2_HOMAM|nr:Gastrula zinc finger protein XlCGF8.2DB-like [Homarus americanus]